MIKLNEKDRAMLEGSMKGGRRRKTPSPSCRWQIFSKASSFDPRAHGPMEARPALPVMGFEMARPVLGRARLGLGYLKPCPIKPKKARPGPPTKARPVRPAYIYNYV
ncbi:hypothetical protein L3X38_024402 [Prunus dulcis]|uniref:Uncharacterized protein n=1 Tax=Prunus dulcis TaxID=3755 RepID=A0AAD4Z6G6_PRUDU|nr:hypothetical protein L3X38_024402 [Prunus dulcis]